MTLPQNRHAYLLKNSNLLEQTSLRNKNTTSLHHSILLGTKKSYTSPWNKKHLRLNLLEIVESNLSPVSIKGCPHSHRSPNAPRAGGWTGVRGAFRGLVTGRPQNEEPGIQSIDILRVFLIYIVSTFLVPSKLLWNLPVGFNNYSDRHFPYKKVCYC